MTDLTTIRPAVPDDHDCLATFFYKMWEDNGMTGHHFRDDWKATTLAFMADAERISEARAFVADEGGRLVGGAQCLVSRKLYPQALRPDIRKDGYIWGVYVEPGFRRQGLATRLTSACTDYLKTIGCTRMILHASPTGKPVYAALGFQETNEMRLEI